VGGVGGGAPRGWVQWGRARRGRGCVGGVSDGRKGLAPDYVLRLSRAGRLRALLPGVVIFRVVSVGLKPAVTSTKCPSSWGFGNGAHEVVLRLNGDRRLQPDGDLSENGSP
jgi:hypothetical protein